MFLARYNPWGKTKRDQLQSWNNLSFDPQKTDADEQIDLVSTLGNMLGQDKQAKMEKFIETMPMIIQTHLIIEPDWKMVIKQAKDLENIIHKFEAPVIATSSLQGAGAVPGLYSHITQSQDQDADNVPKGRGGKKSGKGKQKSQQQPQPPPPVPEEEEQYEETNNYYHNENYRGNSRGCRPYRGQQGGSRKPYRGSKLGGSGQQNKYRGQYQSNSGQYNTSHGGYYNNNNNNYSNYQGRGGHSHGGNNYRGHGHGRGSYRGHNNYQYHQYYTHDDGSQVEQYSPPCTLCGSFNHSPKHCFKGEHDINNLMEKMSLGSNNPHQSGLYQ